MSNSAAAVKMIFDIEIIQPVTQENADLTGFIGHGSASYQAHGIAFVVQGDLFDVGVTLH